MKEAIFTLIGIGMIYVGYFSLRKNLQLKKNGIQTIAKVISNRWVGSSRNLNDSSNDVRESKYVQTVEYRTEKDEVIVVELGGSSAGETPIGTERKIIYDPQCPETVRPNNTMTLIIGPYLFAICGMFMVVWGVVGFLK